LALEITCQLLRPAEEREKKRKRGERLGFQREKDKKQPDQKKGSAPDCPFC